MAVTFLTNEDKQELEEKIEEAKQNGGGGSGDVDLTDYVKREEMPEINADNIVERVAGTENDYVPATEYWKDNTTIDPIDGSFKASVYPTCVTPEIYVVSGSYYKIEGGCFEPFVYQYGFDGSLVEFTTLINDGIFKVSDETATIRFVVPKVNYSAEDLDLNGTIEHFNNNFKLYYCDRYRLKENVEVPAIGDKSKLKTENKNSLVDAINELVKEPTFDTESVPGGGDIILAEKTKLSEFENDVGFITVNDLRDITETVIKNERVELYNSDSGELVAGGYTDSAKYHTLQGGYVSLPPVDVSACSSFTVKVNSFTPNSPTETSRALWMAFLDADLKTLSVDGVSTRKNCNLYGIVSADGTISTYETGNLVIMGNGSGSHPYGGQKTFDVPEGAKYLSLFNMRTGDTIDIEIYTDNPTNTTRIKASALPDEFNETAETAQIAAERSEQNAEEIADIKAAMPDNSISLSSYVPELVDNVALAAKAHMKADSLCFVLFTDTHYMGTDTCYPTEIARQLAEATNASAIVHLGDLAHMATEGKEIGVKVWQKHSRILQKTKIPYLQVVGNHDDGNIYLHNVTNDYSAENYLSVPDLYFATTKQSRNHITMGSLTGGYYYLDDEDSKTRIIVLNCHEYPWEVNDEGVLMYDSNAADYHAERNDPDNATPPHGIMAVYSPEQLLWLANVALDFSDKDNEAEWGVVALAHLGSTNWAEVNVLFQDFKTGTKCTRFGGYGSVNTLYDYTNLRDSLTNDFSRVGARKVALLLGDIHKDQFANDVGYPVLRFLNASPAKEYDIAPTKTKGTPTETAISVLVVTPSENKITELRFGAGTNDTGDHNPLTDYDNYRVVDY